MPHERLQTCRRFEKNSSKNEINLTNFFLTVAFSQLPHLKKHMLSIHGKDKPYMCEVCKDFYKTKQDLQTHSLSCPLNGDLTNDQLLSENVT